MVFSSLLFLCLFFPLVLLLYYRMPRKGRNVLLLLVSLLFYAWGEPKYVFLMLFSILFGYGCGLLIARYREQRRKAQAIFILSIVGNLGILAFFKYTDFFIHIWNTATKSDSSVAKLAL